MFYSPKSLKSIVIDKN